MDIQLEVQKIHAKYGTSEKANYEIQKLFKRLLSETRARNLKTFVDGFENWFNELGDKNIIMSDIKDYLEICTK